MAKKNWRKIGPVTVKDYGGHVNTYNSLSEAVRRVGKIHIEGLKYGWPGFKTRFSTYEKNEQGWYWTKDWICGDSHVFLDEIGLIIPPWRVQEAYRNLPNVWGPRNRWAYRRGSKRFDSSGHYFRRPRTQQERREDGHRDLPTSYDDLPIAARRNYSWKQFRKTRWKGV